ncbi:MAG: tRNA uridine-5-carboxymethylaminomethyl(34) synthesis GTPase MnmE [Sphaerochaetaceae bacterium]|nr:tRNA uridine-5-carboxymethylaminomethyl(34) synthesis GTPase MnmE [Sphaerochaetaceae bacterium]MDD3162579.1 tRNA uridine-5-carboxymethylaminomethyl(34) synthesis GTPase MnmE [Sphaerochaetaceae bacterium]MDD4006497.1 tRNA uridine-5-carboxymethylaminomethyl(34) synthesis GTPase MnmE [Sphaerochaetaceae bacterium]MDD4395965.1 tRNA uridine-5-carboxymethylaminomethyl(34) synthesis GTPase MnmE [Sphaerochaetaceae bacterium]
MKSCVDDDRIFALATYPARSALALFRTSGEGSIESFASCFSSGKKLLAAQSGTLVHGVIQGVDDVVVAVYRKGHGYTGEEALEISCHGSIAAISLMAEKLSSLGFRQAEPGEFTLRAFLGGKLDLTQAEAVNEISGSRTRRAQLLALSRLNGALSDRIRKDRSALADAMSVIEVQLDYAEDEIGGDTTFPIERIMEARNDLEKLARTFSTGTLLHAGARVVLCGAANAGKSTLFNLFLKQDRSIVSPIPGTTRDFIESDCEISGIPIRLFDTAGLRESSEQIESEGIKRTIALMKSADLIVYIVDSASPEEGYLDVKARIEQQMPDVKKLFAWNKTDIDSSLPKPDGFLQLSAETSEGFETLCNAIASLISPSDFDCEQDVIVESPRQHQSLCDAVSALDRVLEMQKRSENLDMIAVEMKEALDQLGYICGELTSDDMLDRIFSGFCVGK